jgi:AcrR family transcriptional regulator
LAVPQRRGEHPPRQARSRETLRRLLDAAEAVIGRHGLDGATLPRIARAADVSTANVYRRFRDKDALIAAVFRRFSEMTAEDAEQPLDTEALRKLGLETLVRQWTAALVGAYRARPGLIRATVEYSRRHPEAPFIRRQAALEARNFDKMATALLLFRGRIRHPDPAFAVRWAMLTAGAVLRDRLLFDPAGRLESLAPASDERLREELARTILRYLDVPPIPRPARRVCGPRSGPAIRSTWSRRRPRGKR